MRSSWVRTTPTSHLGTDWQDQWQRVLRWHQRLGRVRYALPKDPARKAALLDEVFAFYMNCYHLKDWLIESGATTTRLVNDYIANDSALDFCRDICNGLKHYRLDDGGKFPPANPNWTTTEVSAFDSTAFQSPAFDAGPRWVFIGEGQARDMFMLADECVRAWRDFLDTLVT